MEHYVECPSCRVTLKEDDYSIRTFEENCAIDTDCSVCGRKYQLTYGLFEKRDVSE